MDKHIKDLISLTRDNPCLPIITMTYHEVVQEGCGAWPGKIVKVEKNLSSLWRGKLYTSKQKLKEDIEESYDYLTKLSLETHLIKEYNKAEKKEVIYIWINVE